MLRAQQGEAVAAEPGPNGYQTWGFPKIRGTFLGVPIIRIIIYWGLFWGPLILVQILKMGMSQNEGMRGSALTRNRLLSGDDNTWLEIKTWNGALLLRDGKALGCAKAKV